MVRHVYIMGSSQSAAEQKAKKKEREDQKRRLKQPSLVPDADAQTDLLQHNKDTRSSLDGIAMDASAGNPSTTVSVGNKSAVKQNVGTIKYTQSCTTCKLNPYTQCSDHKTDVLFTITHPTTAAANTGSTTVTIIHINNEYSLHKGEISDITKFLRYYPPTTPQPTQAYLADFKTAANRALVEYYWGVCTEQTMYTCVVILAVRCLHYLCATHKKAPDNLYTPTKDNNTRLSSIIQSCINKQHNDKISQQYLAELKTACDKLETFAQTQGITNITCTPLSSTNDIIIAIDSMCECVYKSTSPPITAKK